ncbi:hypothetical protein BZA77DRAFT_129337 [Pyronema omphalodes]|nr:hypothetical protein BZA77DRAFT_129337 [Pyronema omphalodes]
MSSTPFTLRWGILATGNIAELFSRDLLKDPSIRSVSDVQHIITAVGASSSISKASSFASNIHDGKPHNITCHGSYTSLVSDKSVDIIYIATPHSHHYQHALLALRAGKHVLCEKPMTINAAQTAHLIQVAKEKGLFLMEAVWTRFFPLSRELNRLLFQERVLGKISHVTADFGLPFSKADLSHRLLNPKLGGGALLDLGIYSLTWVMMACYADPDNQGEKPSVMGQMLKTKETGVDEFTTISLMFEKSRVSATASCNMTVRSTEDFCRIQGELGDITVQWSPFRPKSFTLEILPEKMQVVGEKNADGEEELAQYKQQPHERIVKEVRKFEIPGDGHGMFYEADACARAIRDKKIEAEICPLVESQLTMEIMDKVREMNGLRYPDELEAVESY